jgi:CRP-like cAMP-binding protein
MTMMLPQDESALQQSLRATAMLAGIPDDVLRELSARMSVRSLADGEVLVEQGMRGDELYIVLSGALHATTVDARGVAHTLDDVEPGEIVGGMNVFSATPSPATFRAIGPIRVGVLTKSGYDALNEASPSAALSVVEAVRPLLQRHRLWVALHMSRMFRDVDRPALIDLQSEFEPVSLYGGEILFRQG